MANDADALDFLLRSTGMYGPGPARKPLARATRPRPGVPGEYEGMDLYDDGGTEVAPISASEAFARQAAGASSSPSAFASLADPGAAVDVVGRDGAPARMSRLDAARQGLLPASEHQVERAGQRWQEHEDATYRAGRPDPDVELFGPEYRRPGIETAERTETQPLSAVSVALRNNPPEPPPSRSAQGVRVGMAGASGAPRAFESARAPLSLEQASARAGLGSVETGHPRFAAMMDSLSAPRTQSAYDRAQEEGALLDMLTTQGAGFDAAGRVIAGLSGGATPNKALRNAPKQELLEREAYSEQHDAKDPGSAASQRARDLLKAALPGAFTDAQLAGITASDFANAMDVAKLRESAETRRAALEREDRQFAATRADARQNHEDSMQLHRDQMYNSSQERALQREIQRDNRTQAREDRLDHNAQLEKDKSEKDQDAAVKSLGEAYDKSGLQGFNSVAKVVDPILANNDDLPGVGGLKGRLPDRMVSDDGVKLRQGLGQALAQYAKGLSGTGMSDTERENFKRISGLAETGTDDAIRQGWKLMKSAMADRANAIAGTYKPEAVKTYGERVPDFAASMGGVQQAPASAPREGDTVTAKNGKRYRVQGGAYVPVED